MKTKSAPPGYRLDAERMGKEATCSLGDARLEKRMQSIVSTMYKRQAASFSDLFAPSCTSLLGRLKSEEPSRLLAAGFYSSLPALRLGMSCRLRS